MVALITKSYILRGIFKVPFWEWVKLDAYVKVYYFVVIYEKLATLRARNKVLKVLLFPVDALAKIYRELISVLTSEMLVKQARLTSAELALILEALKQFDQFYYRRMSDLQ